MPFQYHNKLTNLGVEVHMASFKRLLWQFSLPSLRTLSSLDLYRDALALLISELHGHTNTYQLIFELKMLYRWYV